MDRRRRIRWGIGAAAVALAVGWVWVWPAARGDRVDVVVVGDGAVAGSRDEIARRFRQEGLIVDVRVVDPADCAAALRGLGEVTVVASFDDWSGCGDARADLFVQQPAGPMPHGAPVRAAAPLFHGGDLEGCLWWDTPGAGEARPGLGQCRAGSVVVMESGVLTPAGNERFARLMVEAVR